MQIFSRTSLAGLSIAALALTGCSTDNNDDAGGNPVANPNTGAQAPDAPKDSTRATELAATVETELPTTEVKTTSEIWPEMWQLADSLEGAGELDECQQANLDMFTTLTESTPDMVRAVIDPDEQLDANAAHESIEFYVATEDISVQEITDLQSTLDENCRYEDSEVSTETATASGHEVTVSQSATKDMLNSRVAEVATDTGLVRVIVTYPPSVEVTEKTGAEFTEFVDDAVARVSQAAQLVD